MDNEYLWNDNLRIELHSIEGKIKGTKIVQFAEISILPIGPIKKIAIGFSYSYLKCIAKGYLVLNYGASGNLK